MLSSIPTRFTNLVCTTATYVKKGIMYNKATRVVSVLAAGGAAAFAGAKIYHSCKTTKTWSAILPCLKERVLPYFYANHKITRLSVGIVAVIATLVAVAAYISLRSIRRELRSAQAQNVQLQAQNTHLEAQVAAQPTPEELVQLRNLTHPDQAAALNRIRTAHETRRAELQRLLNEQTVLLNEHTAQHALIQQALTDSQQNLTALQLQHEQDLAALQLQHEQDLAQCAELTQQLQVQQGALAKQEEAHQQTCAALEEQLNGSEQQIATMQSEIDSLKHQIQETATKPTQEQLVSTQEQAHKTALAALERQVAHHKECRKLTQSTCDQLKSANETLHDKISELEKKAAEAATSATAALTHIKATHTREKAALQKQIESLSEQLQNAQRGRSNVEEAGTPASASASVQDIRKRLETPQPRSPQRPRRSPRNPDATNQTSGGSEKPTNQTPNGSEKPATPPKDPSEQK